MMDGCSNEPQLPSKLPTMAVLIDGTDSLIREGIAEWARENGWQIDLLTPNVLPSTREWDGMVATVNTATRAEWLRNLACPFVRVLQTFPLEEGPRLADFPLVNYDSEAIGMMGAEHLLKLGQPHFVFYRRHDGDEPAAMERGFRSVMHAARREHRVWDFMAENPDVHHNAAVTLEKRIGWLVQRMASIPGPIAVMAEEDRYAMDLVYAAQRVGLRIPEDVAILGAGDQSPLLLLSNIGISSVDSNLRGVGHTAAALVARMVAGEMPAHLPKPLQVPPNRVMSRTSTATYAGGHRIANEALSYVRQNFQSQELTSEAVARRLRVTPFGLHKILRREIGISLSQEILRLRMDAAIHLMTDTSLKLESIAHEAGFGSGNHFYRVFKKALGISPQDWRKSREADRSARAAVERAEP